MFLLYVTLQSVSLNTILKNSTDKKNQYLEIMYLNDLFNNEFYMMGTTTYYCNAWNIFTIYIDDRYINKKWIC